MKKRIWMLLPVLLLVLPVACSKKASPVSASSAVSGSSVQAPGGVTGGDSAAVDSVGPSLQSPIEFRDANFEQLVRNYTGIYSGPIYPYNVEYITELDLGYYGVASVGVKTLKIGSKVHTLGHSSGPIADLWGIQYFTSLEYLYGYGHPIKSIQPLANLHNLYQIYLGGCLVTDLTPLASSPYLQFIGFDHNPITTLVPLSGLRYLETLCLGGTQINSLRPLLTSAQAGNLEYVICGGTPVGVRGALELAPFGVEVDTRDENCLL